MSGRDEYVGHPLWKEADSIYQRWTKEEFDIDADRAKAIFYSFWVERIGEKRLLTNKPKKTSEVKSSVLDQLTACLTDWSLKRTADGYWVESARHLIRAYNVARGNQVLVPGLTTRRDLQARERQIADLSAELEKTRKKLFEAEKHFKDCNDNRIVLEGELANKRTQEEVQRQIDIRDSLGSESSAVRDKSSEEENPE